MSQLSELWKKEILPLIIALFAWLRSLVPTPTPTPATAKPFPKQQELKEALANICASHSVSANYVQAAGAAPFGSMLSDSIDLIINFLKSLMTGEKWKPERLQIELQLVLFAQSSIVPVFQEYSPGLAGALTLILSVMQKKIEAEIANPS